MGSEMCIRDRPMMTPWSETIDVNNILGEYPRPQMEREEWLNLNGVWDLRKAVEGEAYQAGFTYDKKILVPFPIESALSGIMEESDNQCYWYRRTLTIPESMKGKNILLHFDAVDWEATVYVNGKKVGSHTGGYDPFYFDITSALTDGGEQESPCRKHIDVLLNSMNEKELVVMEATAEGLKKARETEVPE